MGALAVVVGKVGFRTVLRTCLWLGALWVLWLVQSLPPAVAAQIVSATL